MAQWILVSPHRTDRPWLGERSETQAQSAIPYDPDCYLCPGNVRANGERNPAYESTFTFDNDFAALLSDTAPGDVESDDLFIAKSERGICRVTCFSPRHDLHIGRMRSDEVRSIVDAWALQYRQLAELPYVRAITIFENRGAAMGASNPHPHGQIWANQSVPNDLEIETRSQTDYLRRRNACLLCTYVANELHEQERLVLSNDAFAVVVPFWASWPFETIVIPRTHRRSLDELDPKERDALAEVMIRLVGAYDRIFNAPFPYSMGFHQRPGDAQPHDAWHLHAHYFPPLLRSATIRKYMVGYEMLAEPQRDLTPESAAEILRNA
jgi:UDPglucose--hexose-1-phosphate uridylyltransferase